MCRLEEKFFKHFDISTVPMDNGFERLKEYDKIEFNQTYPEITDERLLHLICISRTIPDEQTDDVNCWSYVPNISELKDEVLEKLSNYTVEYTDDFVYKKVREVFHVS